MTFKGVSCRQGRFSAEDKAKLKQWITETVEGVEKLVAL
jgi:hypothetical protein